MDQVAAEKHPAASREPRYFLTSQSYCCEFDDGAIILELRGGTYLGIDAEHLPKLRHRIGNWPHGLGHDASNALADGADFERLIATLLARGILTTTPTRAQSSGSQNPSTTLMTTNCGAARHRIPIVHTAQFLASLFLVLLHGGHLGLASLLTWIRRRQPKAYYYDNSASDDRCREALVSFFRLRIWFYTALRHCLFDSLVLCVFLTRRSIPCTLVIGVSTKPFAAHSWVQFGECVLNDTAEHVQSFTPILAIGDLK